MNFYKNSDLAKLYNVSPSTIGLWIQQAEDGKNNLSLLEIRGKKRIIRSQHNHDIMELLKDKGKKYAPGMSIKHVHLSKEFYQIYNPQEVLRIYKSILSKKSIPHKYSYYGQGANFWLKYVERSITDNLRNTITGSIELLEIVKERIAKLTENHRINLIDIGPSEIYTLRKFLTSFQSKKFKKVISIFPSSNLQEFTELAFQKDFPNLDNSFHLIDPWEEAMDYLLLAEGVKPDSINLICLLRSIIENNERRRDILEKIYNSMTDKDLFFLTISLDVPQLRTYFDLWSEKKTEKSKALSEQEEVIPKLIGLNSEKYQINSTYSEEKRSRIIQLQLLQDLKISFTIGKEEFTPINLQKNDTIELWKHSHSHLESQIADLSKIGFKIDSVVTSRNIGIAGLLCHI